MGRRTDLEPTREKGIFRTRDGFWIKAIGIDPKTGDRRERVRVVKGITLAEGRRIRDDLRDEIERAGEKRERLRLVDYAESWLKRKDGDVRLVTLERYTVALDQHIVPALGRHYLDRLTPDDVIAWRDERAAATYAVELVVVDERGRPVRENGVVKKRVERRSYHARTVNGWLRILKTMLADAFLEHRLGPSPAARVRALPEPPSYSDDDPNVLDAHELGRLLVAIRERAPAFWPLIATMAYTGLRTSEATALKIDDWDRTAGTLLVRRSAVRGDIVEDTKTGVARRVPVHEDLAAILEAHWKQLQREQSAGVEHGWLFPSAEGTPRYGTTLAKPLAAALRAAEIKKRLTPHGLRRTLNDLLRLVTSREVQQAITGHTTDEMSEHYSHVKIAERAAAVGNVVQLLRSSEKP